MIDFFPCRYHSSQRWLVPSQAKKSKRRRKKEEKCGCKKGSCNPEGKRRRKERQPGNSRCSSTSHYGQYGRATDSSHWQSGARLARSGGRGAVRAVLAAGAAARPRGARRFLANAAKSVLVFIVSDVALSNVFKLDDSRAHGLSMCAAFIALVIWQSRKRSRYIPKAVRQAVIERDLPDGGYDPRKHHIDHIIPILVAAATRLTTRG